MIVPKVAVCPICGKRTYLRIQDGGYLDEYPIRFHCANCRALIKGVYKMASNKKGEYGLRLYNAQIEECDVDSEKRRIRNADYVVEISGELPCKMVREFDGNMIFNTPFLEASGQMDILSRIERLRVFVHNMNEWRKWRSIAFQLLDEGSIEYVSKALQNKMGDYCYECDNYLKTLHCLQAVVQEETLSIFFPQKQDDEIKCLLKILSGLERQGLHEFVERMGGIPVILSNYRRVIEIFSAFMGIYPNLLPAETYMYFKDKDDGGIGIATCSFSDIKTFYQDTYEVLLSLSYIPVCLDNVLIRQNYKRFNKSYNKLFEKPQYAKMDDDYSRYLALDNGKKLEKLVLTEPLQGILNVPANRLLRNGIGHNNISYNGLTQEITVYDQKENSKVKLKLQLLDMAIDCIGLVRVAVLMAEILLFILREELRDSGVQTILHPELYNGLQPNDKCLCGSNKKYKKCCKNEVDRITRT